MLYLKLNGYQIAQALEQIGWSSGSGADGGGVTYSATAPVAPPNGSLWYDTVNEKLRMYRDSMWIDMSLTQAELQAFDTAINSNLPDQTGFDGKFLQTNGISASWVDIDTLGSGLLTATPTITLVDTIEENGVATGTIANYDTEVTYHYSATYGSITDINADTFTYTAPDIVNNADLMDVISIYGTKAGELKSQSGAKGINVLYVPMVADDVLANVNFQDNASYNDGMEFL